MKAHLEANMAEVYFMEDILGFCIKQISRFIAMRRQIWDDKVEPGLFDEELKGGGVKRFLSANMPNYAHDFILDNAAHLIAY